MTSAHSSIFCTSDFIAYTAIFIAVIVEYFYPSSFGVSTIIHVPVGIMGLLLSWMVIFIAKRQFKQFEQPSKPSIATTHIIMSGIYSRSRNPMYVGVVMLVFSIGLIIDSVWTASTALPVLLLIHYLLIQPEEKYLIKSFGENYISYCREVRRWL